MQLSVPGGTRLPEAQKCPKAVALGSRQFSLISIASCVVPAPHLLRKLAMSFEPQIEELAEAALEAAGLTKSDVEEEDE
ncbi:hypothetical protein LBWT_A0900 (plasmid) [Leptolyngbya boryana IAM M-101]|nr:hypothetical protein LBWT_A0900 [Leptolyngbya boryana IAM M-101]BAS66268.1 hypothetical protein LBDG_A0900 [Leptolyngbya boryana dg5]